MSSRANVEIQGQRGAFAARKLQVIPGESFRLHGVVGGHGLRPRVADLLDIAATVFTIERGLPAHRSGNVPVRFKVTIPLREPDRWESAAGPLRELLLKLGNAEWDVDFTRSRRRESIKCEPRAPAGNITQVCMLSGGLDSACGLATIQQQANETALASYYSRQRSAQREIADALGFAEPYQFRMKLLKSPGRGKTFYYRSFFFLSIAAAIADSNRATAILQFENGVLASGIPPSPSWRMTQHAHPRTQELISQVLRALTGRQWQIANPFLRLTKGQAVQAAIRASGKAVMDQVIARTETCWYHASNRIPGGKKRPGVACGVCIPCIVRRTALPADRFFLDLKRDTIRNDVVRGRDFRSYAGLAEDILRTQKDIGKFYRIMPAAARELDHSGVLSLEDQRDLFVSFAKEFKRAFSL